MPRGSAELTNARREEIISACEKLYQTMSAAAFASALAHTLERRSMLLKLLSMNHFDMEENSRPECLRNFKCAYGASTEAVRRC